MRALKDFTMERSESCKEGVYLTFLQKGNGWCMLINKGPACSFKQVLLLGDKEGRGLGCVLKVSRYQGSCLEKLYFDHFPGDSLADVLSVLFPSLKTCLEQKLWRVEKGLVQRGKGTFY